MDKNDALVAFRVKECTFGTVFFLCWLQKTKKILGFWHKFAENAGERRLLQIEFFCAILLYY